MEPQHNPFDEPHYLIQGLQADLKALRAAADAEKEQRSKEVAALQYEMKYLQEALAQEKRNNKNNFERLSVAITSETALRGKQMDKLTDRVEGLSQRQDEFAKTMDGQSKQALKQAGKLDAEVKDRQADVQELTKSLDEKIKERQAACEQISQELLKHAQAANDQMAKHEDQISNMTCNIGLASRMMNFGCSPASAFPDDLKGFGTNLGATGGSTLSTAPTEGGFTRPTPPSTSRPNSGSGRPLPPIGS